MCPTNNLMERLRTTGLAQFIPIHDHPPTGN
jgi:hypothetical protein